MATDCYLTVSHIHSYTTLYINKYTNSIIN